MSDAAAAAAARLGDGRPADSAGPVSGAALLEIGDELLSGKVQDLNGPLVIADLRALGCPLREVRVIADDLGAIASAVRALASRYESVITSGGVGPTHDDVTLLGIARAFDEPLVRSPALEGFIRAFYKGAVNEHLLRMADLPASATLEHDARLAVPIVRVRNVYVLPGEPTIFRRKWSALRERFRAAPFELRRLFTRLDEGELAGWLRDCEASHPVQIGSYPRYGGADYAVMVTIEAKDAAAVDAALAALVARFPAGAVLRTDSGPPAAPADPAPPAPAR